MAEIYVVYREKSYMQIGVRGASAFVGQGLTAEIRYTSSKNDVTQRRSVTNDAFAFFSYYYPYRHVEYTISVKIVDYSSGTVISDLGILKVTPPSVPTLSILKLTSDSVTVQVDHITEEDMINYPEVGVGVTSADSTKPKYQRVERYNNTSKSFVVTFPLKYSNTPYALQGYMRSADGRQVVDMEDANYIDILGIEFTSPPTDFEAGTFEKVSTRTRELDWTKSMEQTFEFYIVDPGTWSDLKRIDTVTSCSIERDSSNATLGSASFECTENVDECYIRAYLIAIQNGITERVPLGTFLVQTPSVSFDGKNTSISLEAYTPLIELKATVPPIGYALLKGTNIMDTVPDLCAENMRAPVVATSSDEKVYDDFVSNLDDTWLSFISDLLANAKFQFGLDEYSRVIFEPVQDPAALRPVWVYNDDNSSILLPDISNERDLYGIPNVVEVVYSTGTGYMFSRIVNDDPNSPVSTVNRGREVVHRESSPNFAGMPTQEYIDQYARQMLRNMSCLEHKVTYSHGYCPVRVGDAVLLNYTRAGLTNVKAKVISQSIKCDTGCTVEETAVYTTKLWR